MTGKMLCLTMLVSIGSTMVLASPLQKSNELAKDGCFIREINQVVPVGTEVTPIGECVIIKCEGKGFIMSHTCPGVCATQDPNCVFTGLDLSVSYPACCPRFTCN